jgi:hypothetical protein
VAAAVATDLTYAVINEDTVTSDQSFGPASPGSARGKYQVGATKAIRAFHATISVPSSALTYPTGGIPISGISGLSTTGAGFQGGTVTIGGLVVGNGPANGGLGCPNEVMDLRFDGESSTRDHVPRFVRGTPGTSPHKLKLFVQDAVATSPLNEVANGTALNDATVFPAGAALVFRCTVQGW